MLTALLAEDGSQGKPFTFLNRALYTLYSAYQGYSSVTATIYLTVGSHLIYTCDIIGATDNTICDGDLLFDQPLEQVNALLASIDR